MSTLRHCSWCGAGYACPDGKSPREERAANLPYPAFVAIWPADPNGKIGKFGEPLHQCKPLHDRGFTQPPEVIPPPVDIPFAPEPEGECDGQCATAADIGLPEYGTQVAYPDPACSLHGGEPDRECACPHCHDDLIVESIQDLRRALRQAAGLEP